MSHGTLPPVAQPPPDLVVTDAPEPSNPAPASSRPWRLGLSVGLAVVILAGSGVARAWQASRVDQILREGRTPLFSLKDIPLTLGPWVGEDQEVDEKIIRITGSTDSIFRTYQNQNTGQRVSILVLFGPSSAMHGHIPEVCYPSSGFDQVRDASLRVVRASDAEDAPSWLFRELAYVRGEAGQTDMQDVLYTWRHQGKWNPNLSSYKELERLPSMFKVQAARRVRNEAELDLLKADNPLVDSLALLMTDIDRRIAAAEAARATTPNR